MEKDKTIVDLSLIESVKVNYEQYSNFKYYREKKVLKYFFGLLKINVIHRTGWYDTPTPDIWDCCLTSKDIEEYYPNKYRIQAQRLIVKPYVKLQGKKKYYIYFDSNDEMDRWVNRNIRKVGNITIIDGEV